MEISIEHIKAKIHIMNKTVDENILEIKKKIIKIKSNGGMKKALLEHSEKKSKIIN